MGESWAVLLFGARPFLGRGPFGELDRWQRQIPRAIRPARSVEPEQVFEIAFEGIRRSSRHQSGIALRFPRIHSLRRELVPETGDTLWQVLQLLPEA